MKTTMNFPDALMAELKRRAREENRTVTSIVEEAVRTHLEKDQNHAHRCTLPTWDGGGSHVDIDDKDAVWDVLDGIR